MSDLFAVFEVFNWFEACIWFTVAAGLSFVIRTHSKTQLVSVRIAAIGFVLFGISDLLEAPTRGLIPAWLWALKISIATLLIGCRALYVGKKNFRLTDRWLIFGMICLVVSGLIILVGIQDP